MPAAYLAMEGLVGVAGEMGPIARFHSWLEHLTAAREISALRILVCLAELLVFGGILIALLFGIGWVTGVQTSALDAFMDRHCWP